MTNIMDNFYNIAMSETTDGAFKAVVLSGIRTEQSNGAGADEADAKISDDFLNITVKPLTPFGDILPDPLNYIGSPSAANDIVQAIGLYKALFTARSDFEAKDHSSIKFGQIVNCYYEKGSIEKSQFVGLRFSEPKGETLDERYLEIASVEGIQSAQFAFENGNAALMGTLAGILPQTTAESVQAFESALQTAITGLGLPFHVTDRSRTVDDQMNRIKNKYTGNGAQEVKDTYGQKKGAKMVAAIESGDEAALRTLAAGSSRHLKGAAIDIRSKHYTDEQMTIVLAVIKRLGGNPLVEPIQRNTSANKKCWSNSGRDVETTSRNGKQPGGNGKGTPCYNEHIHIDIPLTTPLVETVQNTIEALSPSPASAPENRETAGTSDVPTKDPPLTVEQLVKKYSDAISTYPSGKFYIPGEGFLAGEYKVENDKLYFHYTVTHTEPGQFYGTNTYSKKSRYRVTK